MTEHLGMTADERGQALTSAQKQARQVAEVLTAAYLEFRAAAPDVSIDELKTSGERGQHKLVGIDLDEIDEELDYELLEREDFLSSMREDRK